MTSSGEKFDVKKLDLEGLIFFAKIAEQSERYDDMARAMYEVTNREKKLSQECRNLFSVAYKNVVGARRSSWRVIGMIEQKAETDKHKDACKAMRLKVEEELDNTCDDVVDQLDGLLTSGEGNEDEKGSAVTTEEKVFYLKMRGDYYRYKAEYKEDKEKDKAVEKAQEAYEKAMEIAKKNMSPTHPNLLGLALNFSVFYYEILNSPDMACKLAKNAFDDAIGMFSENQQVDDCKDSTLIMQLLRDNLTLWTSDTGAENGGDVQD